LIMLRSAGNIPDLRLICLAQKKFQGFGAWSGQRSSFETGCGKKDE